MSESQVAVSLNALARAWRAAGAESVMVRFRAQGEVGELADALTAAMVAANLEQIDAHGLGCPVGGGGVSATPGGPILFIDFCDTKQALRTYLDSVAQHLDAAGLTGKLVPVREEAPPFDWPQVVALSAAVSLPVDWATLEADDWPAGAPLWYVDDETTDAVLGVVLDWVLETTGDVWFRHKLPTVRVGAEDVPRLVATAIRRDPMVAVTRGTSAEQARRLVFESKGRLLLQLVDPTPWAEQVDNLTDLLTRLAPHIELGLVRYADAPSIAWFQIVNNLAPAMPAGLGRTDMLMLIRHLEESRTPDAYGVQLLTDAHLSHVHDLSGWDTTEVAPGRHLVRARDLAPWYASTEPDEVALEAARADFGEAILREDHYDAEPPTWVKPDELGRLPGSPWHRARADARTRSRRQP